MAQQDLRFPLGAPSGTVIDLGAAGKLVLAGSGTGRGVADDRAVLDGQQTVLASVTGPSGERIVISTSALGSTADTKALFGELLAALGSAG